MYSQHFPQVYIKTYSCSKNSEFYIMSFFIRLLRGNLGTLVEFPEISSYIRAWLPQSLKTKFYHYSDWIISIKHDTFNLIRRAKHVCSCSSTSCLFPLIFSVLKNFQWYKSLKSAKQVMYIHETATRYIYIHFLLHGVI